MHGIILNSVIGLHALSLSLSLSLYNGYMMLLSLYVYWGVSGTCTHCVKESEGDIHI